MRMRARVYLCILWDVTTCSYLIFTKQCLKRPVLASMPNHIIGSTQHVLLSCYIGIQHEFQDWPPACQCQPLCYISSCNVPQGRTLSVSSLGVSLTSSVFGFCDLHLVTMSIYSLKYRSLFNVLYFLHNDRNKITIKYVLYVFLLWFLLLLWLAGEITIKPIATSQNNQFIINYFFKYIHIQIVKLTNICFIVISLYRLGIQILSYI